MSSISSASSRTSTRSAIELERAAPDVIERAARRGDDDVGAALERADLLARAQHGALADAAPVDLGELTDGALREMAAEVAAKKLNVTVDVPPGTATHGSPALRSSSR